MSTHPGAAPAARQTPLRARLGAPLAAAGGLLIDELRPRLADDLGLELLDVRFGCRDATLVLVCREIPGTGCEEGKGPGGEAVQRIPDRGEPPRVSPATQSAPFDGDGTNDLVRFIRDADRSVWVEPLAGERAPVPRLSAGEHPAMLAATIAGDVVLALVHDGDGDPARVAAALAAGRARYEAEAVRAGMAPDPDLYERACRAAETLAGTCPWHA